MGAFPKKLGYWGLMLVFSLAITEVVLHLAAWTIPAACALMAPHRVADKRLGWRFNSGYPDIDAWGFRNPQVPQQVDLVALGDSQTYGYGVQWVQSWPQQLAQLSGLQAYNIACSGYGPAHTLLLWEDALALAPGHIIAALYAGNDAFDSFNLVYNLGQLDTLKTTDPVHRRQIERLEADRPLAQTAVQITRMGRKSWPMQEFFKQYSRLYGLARSLTARTGALNPVGRELTWDEVQAYVQRRSAYCQIFDDGQFRTAFTSPKRLCALDLTDARIVEGQRIALEALRIMADRAAATGTGFTVLFIPTKEYVFKTRVEAINAPVETSYRRLVTQEAQFWAVTRAYLTAHQIRFIDSLPVLRNALDNGKSPYRISWDGHPNAYGYQQMAALIAIEAGFVPPPR